METDYTPNDADLTKIQESLPKIYARRAILGFSVLFSPIFGGFLLNHNLRVIGKKKEGFFILLLSIILTIIAGALAIVPEKSTASATFILNIGGGFLLAEYFDKKYFPNEKLYKMKNIWLPLIIALAISFVLFMLFIYDS